jgi:hypothetical protein
MKIARRSFLLGSAAAGLFGHAATSIAAVEDQIAPEAQIYMFRGLFGIFSLGIDKLAAKLRAGGYEPKILGWEQWGIAANEITTNNRRGDTGHIILIGHSLGSDSTIQVANNVAPERIPIDLIVTFDITEPLNVPANVERFINFYQNNGVGRRATAGPGFQGQLSNVDLSADHSLDHLNIDDSERLQQLVVNDVFDATFQQTQQVPARRRTKTL